MVTKDRIKPDNKIAPFVCIEPWYGRCDKVDFEGDLIEREWINKIGTNEQFAGNIL